jgi:hypothetical protein
MRDDREMVQNRFSSLRVADDDSRTFLAQDSPLFCLRTPVATFLPTEKAEHASWFLRVLVLHEYRTLISHVSPGTSLVEHYLYTSANAGTARRTPLAIVVQRSRERGSNGFRTIGGEIISPLIALRLRRAGLRGRFIQPGCRKWWATTGRMGGGPGGRNGASWSEVVILRAFSSCGRLAPFLR